MYKIWLNFLVVGTWILYELNYYVFFDLMYKKCGLNQYDTHWILDAEIEVSVK